MFKNKIFTGILPALITPIREDGTFLRQAAEEVIDYEFRSPISGFYINGATGEGPVLSEKTRMEMAETAVEKTRGRGKIINHIGAPDTNSAFRLAKHAAEIGCDAVSSVMPNFYFKFTTSQILDYYKRIADISGLPVVVYANGLMNQNPVDFMREAMKIEGVIGVKYTNFDYYDLHRITELNGGDINVLNGPDEMLICGLTMVRTVVSGQRTTLCRDGSVNCMMPIAQDSLKKHGKHSFASIVSLKSFAAIRPVSLL